MTTPEEEAEAKAWWRKNKHKVPRVIQVETGSEVPLGKTGRKTPIVPFDEESVSPRNNPHPTRSDQKEKLQPWPEQGTAADEAAKHRPTEEE
jgi:hypothetical protein